MNEIKEELLTTMHVLIKTSRVLPKEGSSKEMILLLFTEAWSYIKSEIVLITNSLKSLKFTKEGKALSRKNEQISRLNRIVGYGIFSTDNLDIFDCRIEEIESKYPLYDLKAEIKEMKDLTAEYLEYQKDRNELLGSYLPVLGIAFITLLFIYVYGTELIYSKQGSIALALAISFFTCKIKFELTYDISVARHVKFLLERVEKKI